MSSVAELFEQAKQLPLGEREVLLELLHRWQMEGRQKPEQTPLVPEKKIVIPDYAARLREDFPAGPIIDDPQAFWDELRSGSIDCLR